MYIGMHFWARKEGVCLSRDNAFRVLYCKQHFCDGVALNTLGSVLVMAGVVGTLLILAAGLIAWLLSAITIGIGVLAWSVILGLLISVLGVLLLMPSAIFIDSVNRVARWFDLRSYVFLKMSQPKLTEAADQRLRQLAQYLVEVERMTKPFNYSREIAEENFQRAYKDFLNAGLIEDVGYGEFFPSPY